MSIEMNDNRKRPRWIGVLAAFGYFLGVSALVTALYVLIPDTEAEPSAVVDIPLTAITAVATIEVDVPTFLSGEEPIADAAEIILPSVVHIETSTGLGAGVIYDSDGLIVTAAHVVEGQDTVLVRFADGEQVSGTVLGAVAGVDIAVIKVDRTGLTAAVFNVEKPRVGQLAIAVGSPWGLESTVTAGIISAVDQSNCDFGNCFSMVQTDAAINPGNSGGALVDRNGRVVGINVSIRTESGANDGVGFAVPSDVVVVYADSIISGETLDTAFIGVSGLAASGDRAGALITDVVPDTAASQAGIQVDDIVVMMAGVEIQSIQDLQAQVRTHRPGDQIEMVLIRDGDEITVVVTLGIRPADPS